MFARQARSGYSLAFDGEQTSLLRQTEVRFLADFPKSSIDQLALEVVQIQYVANAPAMWRAGNDCCDK
jgi:hypothetical protein